MENINELLEKLYILQKRNAYLEKRMVFKRIGFDALMCSKIYFHMVNLKRYEIKKGYHCYLQNGPCLKSITYYIEGSFELNEEGIITCDNEKDLEKFTNLKKLRNRIIEIHSFNEESEQDSFRQFEQNICQFEEEDCYCYKAVPYFPIYDGKIDTSDVIQDDITEIIPDPYIGSMEILDGTRHEEILIHDYMDTETYDDTITESIIQLFRRRNK